MEDNIKKLREIFKGQSFSKINESLSYFKNELMNDKSKKTFTPSIDYFKRTNYLQD
jgi:hypothetical protein